LKCKTNYNTRQILIIFIIQNLENMKSILLIAAILTFNLSFAQTSDNPVTWKLEIKKVNDSVQEVHISAAILKGWQLYSNDFNPDLGPMVTEFQYTVNNTFELNYGTIPQNSHRKYDDLWGGEYTYFENEGLFIQKLKTSTETPRIEVTISYQVCNSVDGKCIPFETTLKN